MKDATRPPLPPVQTSYRRRFVVDILCGGTDDKNGDTFITGGKIRTLIAKWYSISHDVVRVAETLPDPPPPKDKALDALRSHRWGSFKIAPHNHPRSFIRHCLNCGQEDPCEDPLQPCIGPFPDPSELPPVPFL